MSASGKLDLRSPAGRSIAGEPATALNAVGVAPGSPRVLIVNQKLSLWPVTSDRCGRQTQMLLRHFTPNTTLIDEATYASGTLFEYDRVIVIGNDAVAPMPTSLLEDIVRAERPILWLGNGLSQLPIDMDMAFGFVGDYVEEHKLPNEVEYRNQRYPARIEAYTNIIISLPSTKVHATYLGGAEPVPYIIQGGDFWYVNGVPNLDSSYPDNATDAPTLVFADVLHDFFNTSIVESHQAVVRLEDVSVHIGPKHIIGAADLLRSYGVSFELGLIPAQRFEDGTVVSLRERPNFVRAVRYAVRNGATIVLHGYHHTFGSGEDFEFWDETKNAPLAGETWEMYARKVESGIRILRDLDLEPSLWETPHYAASPLAYQVFSHYFSHANENREPASWLPYPIAPDEYDQVLIPENIGYISPDEGWTVEAQLQRARLLRIVRDSWAVGFYHPASIPLAELESMVKGLLNEGFSFADIGSLPLEVRYDYRPNVIARLREVEMEYSWFSNARKTPWSLLIFLGFMLVFFVRLRAQWRPAPAAVSLVESAQSSSPLGWTRSRSIFLPVGALVVILLVLAGIWKSVYGNGDGQNQALRARNVGNSEIHTPPTNQIIFNAGTPGPATASASANDTWVTSDGWEVSVYYTAVESFHSGPAQQVKGCIDLECRFGSEPLGDYPSDFVQSVKDNGTGRITSGPHKGEYLNWSIDVGYWLDTAPRDARGLVLRPYLSAAADLDIPYVTPFKVLECGVDKLNGAPINPITCEKIKSVEWVVRDRFTEGKVGKHLDLYVGEEDERNFVETSPKVTHVVGATVSMGSPPLSN